MHFKTDDAILTYFFITFTTVFVFSADNPFKWPVVFQFHSTHFIFVFKFFSALVTYNHFHAPQFPTKLWSTIS